MGDTGFKGSGTSQAAAVVSGAVALLLERRPDLSPDQVKAIIKSTADPLSGPGPDAQGAGRLNVTRSLAAPAPTADAARQPFAPAQIRGVIATLVAHLSSSRHADVGPVGPDGASWGAAKWGGAKWGGSLVGRLVVGRLVVGRQLVGRLAPGAARRGAAPHAPLGRQLLGRLVLGRRLSLCAT